MMQVRQIARGVGFATILWVTAPQVANAQETQRRVPSVDVAGGILHSEDLGGGSLAQGTLRLSVPTRWRALALRLDGMHARGSVADCRINEGFRQCFGDRDGSITTLGAGLELRRRIGLRSQVHLTGNAGWFRTPWQSQGSRDQGLLVGAGAGALYGFRSLGIIADASIVRLGATDASAGARWISPISLGVRVPLGRP